MKQHVQPRLHIQPTRSAKTIRVKEYRTLAMIVGTYIFWIGIPLSGASIYLAVPLLILLTTLHSSLQHEVLHGHPTTSKLINELLVSLPIGLFIPYQRFRDQHLAHHNDETLTDNFDDPESNFLSADRWQELGPIRKRLMNFNRTLLGRMLAGPAITLATFYSADIKLMLSGDRRVLKAYLWHIPALIAVIWWLTTFSAFSLTTHVLIAYAALSVLKIRTFLEHRAHINAKSRTVVIEDRGLLALLFLNNNFHAVHHQTPTAPWFDLPRLYQADKAAVLDRNSHYRYSSYREVIQQYLFRVKDPIVHPLRGHRRPSEQTKHPRPPRAH
jgi:fatty acid desaturase